MTGEESGTLMLVLSVVNVPVYLLVGKKMFNGWKGLIDDIKALTIFWRLRKINSENMVVHNYNKVRADYKICGFFVICAFILFAEFFIVWLTLEKVGVL